MPNNFTLSALSIALALVISPITNAAIIDANTKDYSSNSNENVSGIQVHNGHTAELTGSNIVVTHNTPSSNQLNPIAVGTRNDPTINTLILGDQNTNSVSVSVDNSAGNAMTIGLISQTNGHITVNGKNFEVSVIGSSSNPNANTYGIASQGFGGKNDDLRSFVVINAENTIVNVEQNGDAVAAALMAYGRGSIEVNGNLEVNAIQAIVARNYSIVNINENGGATIKLNGDVVFAYDPETSAGNPVDSGVHIVLDNENSYWSGNSEIWGNPPKGLDEVTEMELTLRNKAQWNTDGNSFLNDLNIDDGVINLLGSESQTVDIDRVRGTTGTINFNASIKNGSEIKTGAINIGSIEGNGVRFTATAIGIDSDDVRDASSALKSLQNGIVVEDEGSGSLVVDTKIAEGDVTGAMHQTFVNGEAVGNVVIAENTKLASFRGLNVTALVAWRDEVAYTNQRMEFLRDNSHAYGAWAQVYGGESKYEDKAELTTTTVQVGADMTIGDWVAGAAFSYMTGEADLLRGDADTDAYTLSLYAERNFDSGIFVNGLARYGRLSTDATAGNMDASYDNNAFSLGGNVGYRFTFAEQAFVEPNFGLQYAYVMGDDYKASNGVKVEQDDFDALIASLGARVGFNFPNNAGKLFARASVNHDFLGEIDGTAGNGKAVQDMYVDLGGTWVTYGVGTQFNITDNLSVWGNVDRTTGGEVSTNYMMNAGLRYVF
mgnify:CR=1 FL=1